jgi:fatty-acid peroxygenase
MRWPLLDDTLSLALEGYGWLPNLRRRCRGEVVRTRVMGRRATVLCGPEAARFFYDEHHVRRHGAVPGPVQATLFGRGAVQTLDGLDHRTRKALFQPLLEPSGIAALVEHTVAAWDDAVRSWPHRGRVELFTEASRVLARGVCGWTGVPTDRTDVDALAADLVAMVDGFATAGRRHWRARRARARQEARLADLIRRVRSGDVSAPAASIVSVMSAHVDDPRLAAVELLNVLRPTVAVCWFVAFSGHALHGRPDIRDRLRSGDPAYAEAFGHEVRRFYPFAPFVGGLAVRDLTWQDEPIPADTLVLLDIYGQNHDPTLWPDPYAFDPDRFVGREIGAYDLIPQGGGDPATGHRCPGEKITVALLSALSVRLARLEVTVPPQDLEISLRRIPARPASGVLLDPPPFALVIRGERIGHGEP